MILEAPKQREKFPGEKRHALLSERKRAASLSVAQALRDHV
jgi:hypothetical protein